MKRFLILFICIVGCLLVTSCDNGNKSVDQRTKESLRESADSKQTSLPRSEELPAIAYEVIDLWLKQSRVSTPINPLITELKERLSNDPKNVKVRVMLAWSYHDHRDLVSALKHYLIARQEEPDAADPLIGLGRLCYDLALINMTNRESIQKHSSGLPTFVPDKKTLELVIASKDKLLSAKTKKVSMGVISQDTRDEFLEMAFVKINDAGAALWRNQDYEAAVSAWFQAAESGMALPQFNLSKAYFEGKGVPKDLEKSAYWCRKAADQDFPQAQYTLATMYIQGAGVPEDLEKALDLLKKAASQGHRQAQAALDLIAREENRIRNSKN